MKRLEIIANHSVEEDIMTALQSQGMAQYFTKIPLCHGQGNSEPKEGNAVWPEENFILIIHTQDPQALVIKELIRQIKRKFPNEGIECFISDSESLAEEEQGK